jgi:hypothetical protein
MARMMPQPLLAYQLSSCGDVCTVVWSIQPLNAIPSAIQLEKKSVVSLDGWTMSSCKADDVRLQMSFPHGVRSSAREARYPNPI